MNLLNKMTNKHLNICGVVSIDLDKEYFCCLN